MVGLTSLVHVATELQHLVGLDFQIEFNTHHLHTQSMDLPYTLPIAVSTVSAHSLDVNGSSPQTTLTTHQLDGLMTPTVKVKHIQYQQVELSVLDSMS